MTPVDRGISCPPELSRTGYALARTGITVSEGAAGDLAGSPRRRQERNGARWRLLYPLPRSALTLACLRVNLTCAELAANRLRAPLRCTGERGNAPLRQCTILAAELRRGRGGTRASWRPSSPRTTGNTTGSRRRAA